MNPSEQLVPRPDSRPEIVNTLHSKLDDYKGLLGRLGEAVQRENQHIIQSLLIQISEASMELSDICRTLAFWDSAFNDSDRKSIVKYFSLAQSFLEMSQGFDLMSSSSEGTGVLEICSHVSKQIAELDLQSERKKV